MPIGVYIRQSHSAPTQIWTVGSRRWRDKNARYVLEGIRGAIVQVNDRRTAVDADYDVRRTIAIQIGNAAVHGGISEVRRHAL